MSEEKRKNPLSVYWIYVAFVVVLVSTHLYVNSESSAVIKYKETLLDLVEAKGVKQVKIVNQSTARFQLRKSAQAYINSRKDLDFPKMRKLLANKNAQPSKIVFELENIGNHANFEKALDERGYHDYENIIETNWIAQILGYLLPFGIIVLIWMFVMRRMSGGGGAGGGGGQIFNIGKSRAQVYEKGKSTNITFKDVAGLEGAKEEIVEIVEFLKNPKKYTELGAKIPKGALLVGPPGTGKTLLAKAVAGEAKVPFFSLSGSDFVEMFVGVGASRVRDLFRQAKEKAPAIIFIDEIDAIGRARGKNNGFNTNDERENTLNQLLTEMDGFGTNSGVIILAATNRADVLDSALMRAGRFDRQIYVDMPDLNERKAIFGVHLKPIKLSTEIDVDFLARQTPGFSGADLANLINEAALVAARTGKKLVGMEQLEFAKDKVMMGAERRSMVMSEADKLKTAYHEAGHAIVGRSLEEHDPVYKVTIIPRGRALGVTMFLPEEDKFTYRQRELTDQLCVAMGGRVAEEITFGNVTNGAVGDIRMATNIARKMVCEWGMSEDLGMVEYGEGDGEVFLARDINKSKGYSEETARKIDAEIKKLIDDSYALAKKLLTENGDELKLLAEALLEFETLNAEQVRDIMEHGEMKNPPTPPSDNTIPGNQSDEGVAQKSVVEENTGDDDPLAGEAIGAPA